MDVPIYTFPRYGHRSLKLGYEAVVERLEVDTVIAIDGGTDSLMKGNEFEVATVEEDYNTIFAVEAIQNKNVTQKFMICLGMVSTCLCTVCNLINVFKWIYILCRTKRTRCGSVSWMFGCEFITGHCGVNPK